RGHGPAGVVQGDEAAAVGATGASGQSAGRELMRLQLQLRIAEGTDDRTEVRQHALGLAGGVRLDRLPTPPRSLAGAVHCVCLPGKGPGQTGSDRGQFAQPLYLVRGGRSPKGSRPLYQVYSFFATSSRISLTAEPSKMVEEASPASEGRPHNLRRKLSR